MKDNQKRYWKGLEQLTNDPEFVKKNEKEFPDYLPINSNGSEDGPSRRDFLKMMGFGLAAVSLAACEAPVRYAIPYLNKPVDVDPSIPNYYASTYASEGDYCSIVVKTREGRPIKIEGNRFSDITRGGTSAQVEASILSLYDTQRLAQPLINGEKADWAQLDQQVISALGTARNLRVLSNTILSPATQSVINDFTSRVGGEHIVYDSFSYHALIEANRENFGEAAIPAYDFSQASVIVSFGADFLGSWLSTTEYNKQYGQTRKLGPTNKTMSRHYQFESVMSMTGSNADYRSPIRPSQEGAAIAALYQLISGGDGGQLAKDVPYLAKAAQDLLANRGSSLVVSSSNDVAVQRIVNAINSALGSYGTTIDMNNPAYYRQGNDVEMAQFVQDVEAGRVDAVIFWDCNPVYDYPAGEVLAQALTGDKINLSISTADRLDETSSLCKFVAPDHHFLESWNDFEPKRNRYSLAQPSIRPIFNTRQAQESFLVWSAAPETNYFNYLQNQWRESQFGMQQEIADFQQFWDTVLYRGVFVPGSSLDLTLPAQNRYMTAATLKGDASAQPVFKGNASGDLQLIAQNYLSNPEDLELVIYQNTGIGSGKQANNPWLQELPDPVTKATWDNYLTVSIALANQLGIEMKEGLTGMVNLTVENKTIEIPVVVQPGQANGTVGIALGYGRTTAGKVANGRGVDVYPFVRLVDGIRQYNVLSGVQVVASGKNFKIARTQTHETFMGRETVIQESTLAEYQQNPKAGRFEPVIATAKGPKDPESLSLWNGHLYPNHHWGMVIDLNSCTGCSACVVACHIENNVPVVGKDEVLNRRDMHWLRIDRYYSSNAEIDDHRGLEQAAENPEVTFQPMLCQHCNNAPCETVCPVVATTHSTEGINQMTYNRCIGTRYCANNCPYKVRRFNWFKYHDNKQFSDVNTQMNSDLGKMVLNPDVTVRARGVMEKCSFCVQRIQSGKLQAKRENRRPVDGEIVTACASACPTDAIVFGDLNDEKSQVTELIQSEENGRAYSVLKEVGTRPNVFYLTKIRNKDSEEEVNA